MIMPLVCLGLYAVNIRPITKLECKRSITKDWIDLPIISLYGVRLEQIYLETEYGN